jgi:hypothetical protein
MRPFDTDSLCDFRIGITIGRTAGDETDKWMLLPLQIFHQGHPRESNLRKPISLHAQHELQLAADIINVYGGSGVAKSVYYYRTGEVLDRQLLHRLQSIAEKATLGTGSPAESLLEDLRSPLLLVLVPCFSYPTSYISSFYPSCPVCRSDNTLDFIAVYNASADSNQNIHLMEKLGGRPETTSIFTVSEEAAQDISSTRNSMKISCKMLLGTSISIYMYH